MPLRTNVRLPNDKTWQGGGVDSTWRGSKHTTLWVKVGGFSFVFVFFKVWFFRFIVGAGSCLIWGPFPAVIHGSLPSGSNAVSFGEFTKLPRIFYKIPSFKPLWTAPPSFYRKSIFSVKLKSYVTSLNVIGI